MNLKWHLSIFIFGSILLYPPFIFSTITPTLIRVTFFCIIIFLVLLKSAHIRAVDFVNAGLIMLVCFIGIIADTVSDSVISALSAALTLVFALSLSRAIRDNVDFRVAFISGYVALFFLIPSLVILGFLWGLIFSTESNIFSIPIPEGGNLNKFNLFGVLLDKDPLMGFDIYRSFSYFLEPVYLAPYLACNYYLVSEILPNPQKNRFKWLNGIAGIFTFSYLFPAVLVFLFMINNKRCSIAIFFIITLFALVILGVSYDATHLIYEFLHRSSLEERLYRMSIFTSLMQNSDAIQIMFGRGYQFKVPDFEMDIGSGILNQVVEVGLVGAAAMFVFVLNVVKWRWEILLFSVLIGLVFAPLKLPLFWVLLTILVIYYESLGESKAQHQQPG